MNKELTELLEQFQKQKKSAWDEICKLENELNITSGYTHDWTLGKHATFSFAEKELAKIIGEANIQPDVSGRSEQFNCVHSYDHVLTVKNLKYKCKYCKHEKWEQLN